MTAASHISKKKVRAVWHSSSEGLVTFPSGRSGIINHISSTWKVTVNFLAPVGYQDETGFHYGEPPALKP